MYGLGGELLAEYPANGNELNPQKEYGYRNGQLLVTATPSSDHSLKLNGSSAYVQVPNSSSLNITGAITVEAWIKLNAITGVYQDIITRESYGQGGTGGGYELSFTNLGKLRLDLYQGPMSYTTVIGNTTISTGEWHHVAGVFNGKPDAGLYRWRAGWYVQYGQWTSKRNEQFKDWEDQRRQLFQWVD